MCPCAVPGSGAMNAVGGTARGFCDVNVPASAGDASGCGWQPLALPAAVPQVSRVPWEKREPVPAASALPDGWACVVWGDCACLGFLRESVLGKSRGSP